MRKAAEQGDPDAQYKMGIFYVLDIGVETNMPNALESYQKSAEGGYAPVQHIWCRKSAEQGYERAQKYLDSLP
ncbi:MAG: sel1 repeat family protein [Verrucomicrobia bacterium]|nr:sel1 repeat family protein [Verrucomicrobiota bacterium]